MAQYSPILGLAQIGRLVPVAVVKRLTSLNTCHGDSSVCLVLRHKVKPGITGWAQVNGWRGETETVDKMQKRVKCDLQYIRNWSLWLDVKIVALTVVRGFTGAGAY